MKFVFLILFALGAIANADDIWPEPIAIVTTNHDDPSDISKDEISIEYRNGSVKSLTNNGLMERAAVLSCDNSLISFIRRTDSNFDGRVDWNDDAELWIMKLDNRSESRVPGSFSDCSQSSWHPNSHMLAFIARDAGRKKLFIFNYDKNNLDSIDVGANSWPAWSPDGNYISFYDLDNCVCTYNIKNKKTVVVSKDVGRGWSLRWTDDNKLVFAQNNGKEFYMYNPVRMSGEIVNDHNYDRLNFIDQEQFNWAKKIAK